MAKPLKSNKNKTSTVLPASESTEQLESPVQRRALYGWPMVIGWIGMLVFTFYACTHMVAAGDTWVAMACGRHFANHGVDTVEPFSANAHTAGPTEEEIKNWPNWAQWITEKVGIDTVKKWHPTGWINQNWLTHRIFYSLIPKSTYEDGLSFTSNALVYWKFAIYIITVVCVYYTSRLMGVNPALAALFCCFAMLIGRSFLDIRPAGFSNMLVAVYLLVLALTIYKNVLFIWLIVPIAVFWCNVHGGYIYLFIMLVPFILWHLLMILDKRWTLSGYCILGWTALYGLAYQFLSNEYLEESKIHLRSDWLFYLLVVFIAACIFLTWRKRTKLEELSVYHLIVSAIVFVLLLPRFFPAMPENLTEIGRFQLRQYMNGSRFAYVAIFAFIMILRYILSRFKEKLALNINLRGIFHIAIAGFVAFVAVIVFNPFHLTNLTHTFVISVSEHAARWRQIHEWQPAFDWSNPVGTAIPFLILYIICWTMLIAWSFCLIRVSQLDNPKQKRRAKSIDAYQWPKVDLALLVIAALTVYMAIRSRRFIPIAAIAACPIVALLIDQTIQVIWAMLNRKPNQQMVVPPMPREVRTAIIIAGAVLVMFFGIFWGAKFKRIYLDAWPNDPKYTSVFMRMTASDAKPFYATKFISDNKLEGKMFNYWTEGGFIAWRQEPGPDGQTPLQLFMDGRAQAAYNRDVFDEWSRIMAGGTITYQKLERANTRGQELTTADYREIGEYMDTMLRQHDVWLFMMPSAVFNDPDRNESYYAVKGLESNPNWPLVFFNNEQKIYVDARTTRGRELFNGIFTGDTIYPDKYHQNLVRAHSGFIYTGTVEDKKEALGYAIEAFDMYPSAPPIMEMIMYGVNFSELVPSIDEFCKDFVQAYIDNKDEWFKKDGYRERVDAARLACFHCANAAGRAGDGELVKFYSDQMEQCIEELYKLTTSKRW